MKNSIYLYFVIIPLIIISCQKEPPVSVLEETTISNEVNQTELIPNSTTGFVIGTLLFEDGENSKPVENVSLFLAKLLKDDKGTPRVAAIDRTDSQRTATASDGSFIFSNVPPGNYGIVLDVVLDAYLLPEPDSDNDLIITVSANKVLDLGTLVYNSSILPGLNIP
jgi:hypothetical protein